MHSPLQVKPASLLGCPAFGFELLNGDHVRLVRLLLSFRLELPGIRRILIKLIDDQVKHVFEHVKLKRDHVKLHLKLSCSGAIVL